MSDFKASDKIDVSVSQSMKSYPKLCHRLLILSNCWASEKSTSRCRKEWKLVQNMGDWIVRCTRNCRSLILRFRKCWKNEKKSKFKAKCLFYFLELRGPGNASAPLLCCQRKAFACFIFLFGTSKWGSDMCAAKIVFKNSDLHLRIENHDTKKEFVYQSGDCKMTTYLSRFWISKDQSWPASQPASQPANQPANNTLSPKP